MQTIKNKINSSYHEHKENNTHREFLQMAFEEMEREYLLQARRRQEWAELEGLHITRYLRR